MRIGERTLKQSKDETGRTGDPMQLRIRREQGLGRNQIEIYIILRAGSEVPGHDFWK